MKTKKGSSLVFVLLLLIVMLVVSVGLYMSSIIEQRASIDTQKSTVAIGAADTGIELVTFKINEAVKNLGSDTATIKNAGLCENDYPWYEHEYAVGKTTKVTYRDNNDVEIINCETLLADVKTIVSDGMYGGTTRALEVNLTNVLGPCEDEHEIEYHGVTYPTVTIGDQCWMSENLRTTKYQDDSDIAKGDPSDSSLAWLSDNAYYSCPPNVTNDGEDCDAATNSNLGLLYQWGAVTNMLKICPDGWHVPTDEEFHTLEDEMRDVTNTCDKDRLGLSDCLDAGQKLLSGGGTGFELMRSGYRGEGGDSGYYNRDEAVKLWSATENSGNTSKAIYREFNTGDNGVIRNDDFDKTSGLGVRCIRDDI